ncbi:MAG: hypothetical protein V1663_03795 [archaeon]
MDKKYKYLLGIGFFLVLAGIAYAATFYENVDVYGNFRVFNTINGTNYTQFVVNSSGVNTVKPFVALDTVTLHKGLSSLQNINIYYADLNVSTGNIRASANTRETCSWSYITYSLGEQAVCSDERFQAGMQLLRSANATIQYKIYCCEL